MTTIRSFIATIAKKKWSLYQLDVNNAFFHGDLYEKIYMKPPPRLNISDKSIVCKLKKSLCGHKQAYRQLYSKLYDSLRNKGCVN